MNKHDKRLKQLDEAGKKLHLGFLLMMGGYCSLILLLISTYLVVIPALLSVAGGYLMVEAGWEIDHEF